MIHIPRIGQEVIVAFLEGDPDQPIIVGSVYNADQMPPYELPDNKTQSGVKTHAAARAGRRELQRDPLRGQEGRGTHLHPRREGHGRAVENNYTRSVGGGLNGDPKKVGKSGTTVYGDHSLTVQKGDMTITVEAGKTSVTVEKEIDVKSNTSFIHVDSPTQILLTVKGSFIEITPDTITLHAEHIKVEGGTDIKMVTPDLDAEGSTQVKMHGAKVTVDGESEAFFQSSGGPANFTAATKATHGVGGQTVVCDTAEVKTAGAAVKVAAMGVCEINGATIKLN